MSTYNLIYNKEQETSRTIGFRVRGGQKITRHAESEYHTDLGSTHTVNCGIRCNGLNCTWLFLQLWPTPSIWSQDSHLLIGLLRPIADAVIGYFGAVKVELARGERPSKPAVSNKHSPRLSITTTNMWVTSSSGQMSAMASTNTYL